MKILFIVQGEGRGHLTQAIALEKLLRSNGHEVVEILVGKSKSRRLPEFFFNSIHSPVKQFVSPNFLPTPANKRANLPISILYNLLKVPEYVSSMIYINQRIRATEADLVINFYELLTGLTYFFFQPRTPHICIGHQYLFLHKDFQFPPHCNPFLLNLFTRITALGAGRCLALSFRSMKNDGKISVVPPLLRREIFEQESRQGDYIHGYMVNAGFSEYVVKWHQAHPQTPLRFFRDRKGQESVEKIDETLSFYPLNDVEFIQQMAGCKAYASTAGFESICEAMYLGKPVLMVPAHIEQECNAFDAERSGAGITDDGFNLSRLDDFAQTYQPDPAFAPWIQSAGYIILDELESYIPQNIIQHMYMVDEFI